MDFYMIEALKEANLAYEKGEVPIGAIILKDGQIIARAHNLTETNVSAIDHAEILCIQKAVKKLNNWRLDDCEMYVTVEPCAMCAGAIINSRIAKVTYGAKEPKFGCHQSLLNILSNGKFNHSAIVVNGVMEKECSQIIKKFFRKIRK